MDTASSNSGNSLNRVSAATPWPWWTALSCWVVLLLVLLFVVRLVVRMDAAGGTCFSAATPFIQWIVDSGRWLTMNAVHRASVLGWASFAVLTMLGVGGIVRKKRTGIRPALLLVAGGIAVLAQAFLFAGSRMRGCVLYAVMAILIAAWRFIPESLAPRSADGPDSDSARDWISPWTLPMEILLLGLILVGTILYRFYALNHLPPDFDGEMALCMAASTSRDGLLQINYGAPGMPWSPLGLFYFLFLYIFEGLFGTTLLAVRMISAVVGVLVIPIFYALLRRMAGVIAALIGAVLLAFSPIEIVWGRMDFFPLSYPSLFTLLICWTTWLAATTERWRYFICTVILMGLCYHVFPSGQTAFLIPVAVFAWYCLTDWQFVRRCRMKVATIPIGVGLWLLGLPLSGYLAEGVWRWQSPFTRNPGKTIWSLDIGTNDVGDRLAFVVERVWDNIVKFLESVFVENRWPYHTTPIHSIPGHPSVYLPGLVAILLAIGFIVILLHPRRKVAAFLLIWIFIAALPGILSTEAAARRLGTIFPALIAVSAITASRGFDVIQSLYGKSIGIVSRIAVPIIVLPFLAIIQGSLYFWQAPGPPPSVQMANAIRPYVAPGTLVVADIQSDYYTDSEVEYLLMNHLADMVPPCTWYYPAPGDWPALAVRPKTNPDAWYYRFTVLQKQVPELRSRNTWPVIVYIIQNIPTNQEKITLLRDIYPEAEVHYETPSNNHWYDFAMISVQYDLMQQVVRPSIEVKGFPQNLPLDPTGFLRDVVTSIKRNPNNETEGVALSAGLWIENQSWESFRLDDEDGASTIVMDGIPLESDTYRPLTDGVHRLVIEFSSSMNFPVRILSRSDRQAVYQPLSPARLVSPRLCEVPLLKPQAATSYPGFESLQELSSVEHGYSWDFALSPSGHSAAFGMFPDSWKILVFQPNGELLARWERPIQLEGKGKHYWFTFVGDDKIAVLDCPKVRVFDIKGEDLSEFALPIGTNDAQDIGANAAGDVFVTCSQQHLVFHYTIEGKEMERLTPPPNELREPW
ncbi:MAG TPA: glycosyltransferase family 39 protein, partial [bacterium]|nr:glycosyltransferase family 39 protein [bacterium]